MLLGKYRWLEYSCCDMIILLLLKITFTASGEILSLRSRIYSAYQLLIIHLFWNLFIILNGEGFSFLLTQTFKSRRNFSEHQAQLRYTKIHFTSTWKLSRKNNIFVTYRLGQSQYTVHITYFYVFLLILNTSRKHIDRINQIIPGISFRVQRNKNR